MWGRVRRGLEAARAQAVGFQSANLRQLTDWQSRVASIIPGVTLPIFTRGRLEANLDATRAQHRQTVAAYVNQVLTAYADVEDALTDVHAYTEEIANLRSAVGASEEYLRMAQVQYNIGLVDYLTVIDAERTLLSNQLSLAQTVNLQLGSSIRLVKALGVAGKPPRAERPDHGRSKASYRIAPRHDWTRQRCGCAANEHRTYGRDSFTRFRKNSRQTARSPTITLVFSSV